MTVLRLVVYTALSLFLAGWGQTASSDTVTATLKDASECLVDMNAAREASGLKALAKSRNARLPTTDAEHVLWKLVCDALLEKERDSYNLDGLPKGDYAMFELGEGTSPQCSAAVKDWQSAFTMFQRKNPPIREDVIAKGRAGLAFVALYNPYEGAEGECQVVACTDTATGRQVQAQAGGPPEGRERREGGGSHKTVSALLCLTFPHSFAKTTVFTQEQWDKIVKSLSSSASQSTAVPSFLTFAAVLAGVILW
ncbi:hypothetical protein Esti_001966 [Eimeria stiedai]